MSDIDTEDGGFDAPPTEESGGDESATDPTATGPSAGRWQRAGAAAVGGYLLLGGLRKRSVGGVARSIVGGALLYRGVTGRRLPGGIERRIRDRVGGRRGEDGDSVATVERSIVVDGEPEDLAAYWREPDSLDRLLGTTIDVEETGEDLARWTVDAPLGRRISWESELVADEPGEALRWESLEGATIRNDWSLRFHPAPGDRGTEVSLELRIDPPGGAAGAAAMDRLGVVPEMVAGTALGRFKSLAETGEIPTLEKNPSGRGRGDVV